MTDFQNLFILITGRERMAYIVLDYLEEGYMELALILKTQLMISSPLCNVSKKEREREREREREDTVVI